jgi:hypothetical protein
MDGSGPAPGRLGDPAPCAAEMMSNSDEMQRFVRKPAAGHVGIPDRCCLSQKPWGGDGQAEGRRENGRSGKWCSQMAGESLAMI